MVGLALSWSEFLRSKNQSSCDIPVGSSRHTGTCSSGCIFESSTWGNDAHASLEILKPFVKSGYILIIPTCRQKYSGSKCYTKAHAEGQCQKAAQSSVLPGGCPYSPFALCGTFPPLTRLGTGQNVPGLICIQRDDVNVRNLKDIKLLRRDVHPGLSWP